MLKSSNHHKHLPLAESNQLNKEKNSKDDCWDEYSTLHDSFTELLSYERGRNTNFDFWQLNYI